MWVAESDYFTHLGWVLSLVSLVGPVGMLSGVHYLVFKGFSKEIVQTYLGDPVTSFKVTLDHTGAQTIEQVEGTTGVMHTHELSNEKVKPRPIGACNVPRCFSTANIKMVKTSCAAINISRKEPRTMEVPLPR
jgi:hypothetical protein